MSDSALVNTWDWDGQQQTRAATRVKPHNGFTPFFEGEHAGLHRWNAQHGVSAYLHDSYKLEAGVGRVLKLSCLDSWRSEVVPTQLHVYIDPRIYRHVVVVKSPV